MLVTANNHHNREDLLTKMTIWYQNLMSLLRIFVITMIIITESFLQGEKLFKNAFILY